MAVYYSYNASQNLSRRWLAMVLALVSAIVLSPLYNAGRKKETKLSSGFVLPMVVAGLIIAIRTVSSSSLFSDTIPSAEASWVLRIGTTSWGLAGILLMLMFVLSWQNSVKEFFWR